MTKPILDEDKEFSVEEVEAALQIANSEYFMQVVALLSHRPENTELNYIKVPIVTPQGGNYLVCILHIDGPKVDLIELTKNAKALQEKEKA